jgi:uncharacterized protein (DUF1800 family)
VKLTRRQLLGAGALTAIAGGCAPAARQFASDLPKDLTPPPGEIDPTLRLVNRATFGPKPGELARVASLGHAKFLEEQLAADTPEPVQLTMQLYRLDALRMDSHEMEELPLELVLSQLQQAAILRAVYSPNQLRERLVEFWTDHFNIYGRKGSAAFQKGVDDANVIRTHALGNFHDLLLASARSPAMLAYLDNQVNVSGIANENYARELMELHTLGVGGGYTQRDVQEVARCFTGWGIEDRFLMPKGKFRFDPDRHDTGAKTVFGIGIPAGRGIEDGERVIELLSLHPNTAKFVCGKLCRFFLGHTEERTVEDLARAFLDGKGEIKPVLRSLLSDKNLLAAVPAPKRPFDYMISALRALGAETDGSKPLQSHLEKMGMPLYQWPMPDGYPMAQEAWTGTLLARWNFAADLAKGQIPGTVIDLEKIDRRSNGRLAAVLMGSNSAGERIERKLPGRSIQDFAVACLASPEFQWR